MARGGNEGQRVAVVLFNLGGPSGPAAVRPFLFNLFSDPAIIGLPAIFRYPLAALISATRARSARANYALMGGGSPLLAETEAQAAGLQAALEKQSPHATIKVFIAMRYWAPLTGITARRVADFAPDQVVLLPLYPHYSTTTTGSSLRQWKKHYRGSGEVSAICCYPRLQGLIEAHAGRIRAAWSAAGKPKGLRLLFSAHGLPQSVVDGGDPYQAQIEATASAVAARLSDDFPDWRICYQSKVGPMTWLGPSTPDAIAEAGEQGLGVIITPIAFVSEHIETLVELDHDYAAVAQAAGAPHYIRVPALGLQNDFIEGLAELAVSATGRRDAVAPGSSFCCETCWRKCPAAQGTWAA